MTKKLLAIGGPFEGQWLPDFDMDTARFPTPLDAIKWEPDEVRPDSIIDIKVAVYKKGIIADYSKRGSDGRYPVKVIYFHSDIGSYDYDEALYDFLFKAFMNMEEPDGD